LLSEEVLSKRTVFKNYIKKNEPVILI